MRYKKEEMMWLDQVTNLLKKRKRCPVGTSERIMLDKIFIQLVDELGEEIILNSSIFKTPKEITGEVFSEDEAYAQLLFQKLGYLTDVDLELVELGFFCEKGDVLLDSGVVLASDTGGKFSTSKFTEYSDGSFEILINQVYLEDSTYLVSAIAFELARLKLRREGKEYSEDHLYIELVPLFLGLGVFIANSSIVKIDTWSGDLRSGWVIKRGPSQLSPEAHGYLLAHYSCYRGEQNPEWANFLDKEVKKAFSSGVRYLRFNSKK